MKHQYKVILLSNLVCFILPTFMFACAALTSAVPVLSQADAIGRGVAHVLGWCEDNKVSPDVIAKAAKELADKQYLAAISAVEPALTKAINRGEVPVEVQTSYQLAKGLAAAYAVEQGMRALSGRNPDGSAKKTE
jgi:hypothetical protein